MLEFNFSIIVIVLFTLIGYQIGEDNGRVSVFNGDYVCQKLIDSAVRCVPKEDVKP